MSTEYKKTGTYAVANSFYSTALTVYFLSLLFFSPPPPPGPCIGNPGTIGGNIFEDFNFNGVSDDGNIGVENIDIYIYESDISGNSIAVTNTTSDQNGDYYFDGLTDGKRYRLEFIVPSNLTHLSSSPDGTDSETSVQYVVSPTCSADFGLANAAILCGDDADLNLITPCYISGDPLAGGSAANNPGLISVPYAPSGTSSQNTTILEVKDIGTTWGVSYDANSKAVYTSSVLKRHSGFGPGGTGAIYGVDFSNPASASIFSTIDLDGLGFDTGTDPRILDPLPAAKEDPSFDVSAFSLAGKMSLGGMDMSLDGEYLYVVNLFDKKLYSINVKSPFQAPTPSDVSSVLIPDPNCSDGDYRPWAVKFHEGKVYVGIICSAETSQDTSDLHAWIYVHDPNGAPNNFSPVFDFKLSFVRGLAFFQDTNKNHWFPWQDNYLNCIAPSGSFTHPQPILSSIEFDNDGSLMLGFLDRMGMQGGYIQYPPNTNAPGVFTTNSAGDIIRVCKINGIYELEGSTLCGTAGGNGNGEGPGGNEYYWSDTWPYPNSGTAVHGEIFLGGLAFKPGSSELISTCFDPLNSAANTGGFTWINNSTGARNMSYEIYEASIGFSGKSNGLGDISISCVGAPLEIGNYVWVDENMDGIQDPGEAPLPGVRMTLFKGNDSIATVLTDADGEYIFNDQIIAASSYTTDDRIEPNTQYSIVLGNGQFNTNTQRLFGSYILTVDSTGMGLNSNLNDSDGELGMINAPSFALMKPFTVFNTGNTGINDHTLDFGFFMGLNCDLMITSVDFQPESCLGAGDGSITVNATSTNQIEFSINGGPFSSINTFSNLTPGMYNIVIQDQGDPSCFANTSVMINGGVDVEAPTNVLGYEMCQFGIVPGGEGMTADCGTSCPVDSVQELTWWTAPIGGTKVWTGNFYNPIISGHVNPTVVGTTTFYAQCACGICESTRVPADFVVYPQPAAPTTTGYEICQFGNIPTGEGLIANCTGTCPVGQPASVTWWTAPVYGTQVETGMVFNPVSTGHINPGVPGTYTFFAQCECGICASLRTPANLTIYPEPVAPVVTNYTICQFETVTAGEGMIAACSPCPGMLTQRTTWWDAPIGGNEIFVGDTFDPTSTGHVDASIPGTTPFWVQCECGDCIGQRSNALFTVNPLPQPLISGERFVCPGSIEEYSTPYHLGSTYIWTLIGDGTITNQNGNTILIEWGDTKGGGPYVVEVKETDLNGCMNTDTVHVSIVDTYLACNDKINISLDSTGISTITPDMILEGSHNSYSKFSVVIHDGNINLGDKIDCRHIGKSLKVTVIGECDQNSCWSTIWVEDKLKPWIECPSDTTELLCFENPNQVAFPLAKDNCDPNPSINLVLEEVLEDDICVGKLIRRTFVATDFNGISSEPCVQYIKVLPPEAPQFPEDITWTCEQYKAYPNIVEPTALHNCILDNAALMDKTKLFCSESDGDDVPGLDPYDLSVDYWTDNEDLDVTLDPNYDDNIDNPITDPLPNSFEPGTMDPIISTYGNASAETDDATNVCNTTLGMCPYFDTVIHFNNHYPDTILTPIYRPLDANDLPVRGLEDADVLELTGSGIPINVNSDCTVGITYTDQKVAACTGVDTTVSFKILRTWTVANWCTGLIHTDIQVIKVIDKINPIIKRTPYSVTANVYGTGHQLCSSTDLLLPATISDNCSPNWTVNIFTPIGEAVYVNGVDGKDGGYIPAPGLLVGVHPIRYVVVDACGNQSEITVPVEVLDEIVPVMICREFTQVALTSDGTALVDATDFDEGTFDNCCLDSMFVKRMGAPDTDFAPNILFDCSDTKVTVILRAYDCSGNYNDCMVEVFIEDKVRPYCIAPDDVWTYCDSLPHNVDFYDTTTLRQLYGSAKAVDNCSAYIEELAPDVDIDQCGIGAITRRFRAFDWQGNSSVGLCRQTIMIQSRFDYKVNLPGDWEGTCGEMVDAPSLTYEEGECDQIAVNYEDQIFNISSDGACYKIVRKWSIMNWCEYDGFSDPLILDRLDYDPVDGYEGDAYMIISNGRFIYLNELVEPDTRIHASTGYYQYNQIIKVFDPVAPSIVYSGPTQFCGGLTQNCTGDVRILPTIDEDCTLDVELRWSFDYYNDGNFDANGLNQFSRTLNLGEHRIVFYASDGCGNTSSKEIIFTVDDCKKPTPICYNGLSADLMHTGMVEIWASDFEQGSSFDYCTAYEDLVFRINRITDSNGDGLINSDDYITTPPVLDVVQFWCDDIGLNYVQMWVRDEAGNWDYCTTFIDIQDNFYACGPGSRMGGKITNEDGDNVQDVNIQLSGSANQTLTTGTDGSYSFGNVPHGNDYTITPLKDDKPTNGVSTFDLVLISKHILNVEKLDSPYKMIAADANNSGSISTLDLLEIRKLVLRVSQNFRNNTSWRFVDKNYVFPDPSDPFSKPFPEVISFNDFSAAELNANFIAIKIGDVNGNAKTNTLTNVDTRSFTGSLEVLLEEASFEKGESFTANFTIEDIDQISGFQFTLNFKNKDIEFLGLNENQFLSESNIGTSLLDEDVLTFSWNKNNTSTLESDLTFELQFKAKEAGNAQTAFDILSNYTPAEAYDLEGNLLDLNLKTNGLSDKEFKLYQNSPNPFKDKTVIGFDLPEASNVVLNIMDVNGKTIKSISGEFALGYNQFVIELKNLNETGVYYYQLETPSHTATRKMIFVK